MGLILDQFGKPIMTPAKPDTKPIQPRLVDRYSMYPSYSLTPLKLTAIFREADQGDVTRQSELFEEMKEKDAHLGSLDQTRRLAVMGLTWKLAPGDDTPQAKKIADFCDEILRGPAGFDAALLDVLDAPGTGFSACEILWDTKRKKAEVVGLRWIHPKRVTFVNSLVPLLITDENPGGMEFPAWKILYHRSRSRSGQDSRAGYLRVCAWLYLFKNYALKDWAAFVEIFGMPLRLGKYEPGATDADKTALAEAVKALGTDAAGIISKNTEITFEEVKTTGANSVYRPLAEYCDKGMSKIVLGQTATTEGTPGSLGNQDTQGDVRQDLLESDCEAVSATTRAQLLTPITGFNFGWEAPVPYLEFNYEPPEDLKSTAEVYQILRRDLKQPMSQEHVSERFGVPLPEENETLLPDSAPAAPFSSLPLKQFVAKSVAEGPETAPGEAEGPGQVLTRLGDKALAVADFGPMLAPIAALLEQSTSLEDFRDRLMAARGDMDASEFGVLMQKALVLADLAGRFDALPASSSEGRDKGIVGARRASPRATAGRPYKEEK